MLYATLAQASPRYGKPLIASRCVVWTRKMKVKAEVNSQKLDSKSHKYISKNSQETPFQTTFNTPHDKIMHYQRTIGNRAVVKKHKSGILQKILRISAQSDSYEYEADRITDPILGMPNPQVRKQAVPEEDEELVQTRPLVDQLTIQPQRQMRRPAYTEDQLFEMSVFPGKALSNWNRLSRLEQENIFHRIMEYYGEPFKKEFEQFAKGELTPNIVLEGRITRTTLERIKLEKEYRLKGYKKAKKEEIPGWRTWVSPSGYRVQILIDRKKRTTRSPLEREHGPIVYFSENTRCYIGTFSPGVTRRLEMHADGTIAIYTSSVTEMPYTLRLSQSGQFYRLYDQKGEIQVRVGATAFVDIETAFQGCAIPDEIKDKVFLRLKGR